MEGNIQLHEGIMFTRSTCTVEGYRAWVLGYCGLETEFINTSVKLAEKLDSDQIDLKPEKKNC